MAESATAVMEQLHEEHAAALWNFCMRLTGYDRALSEDVVQETFLRAWRGPNILDRPTGALRAWLFTVARNLVIDDWRRRQSHGEVTFAVVPDRPEQSDQTDRLLESWIVAEALTRLSREHRDVLRECYYRGASVAQAAERLGVPEGTVKSRTHYALRALRLALEEMGVNP